MLPASSRDGHPDPVRPDLNGRSITSLMVPYADASRNLGGVGVGIVMTLPRRAWWP